MSLLYRWISRLPNYVRSFGLFFGTRLLFSLERSVPNKSIVVKNYIVPGYPGSIFLRNDVGDHSIFWQCIVRRQYDLFRFPQSRRLAAQYQVSIEKGSHPLIIDCGGNIGLSTLYLSTLFPEANIYVIEPDKSNFEILKKNIAPLGERIVPILGGIWHESGNLRIVNLESGSASFRVAATSNTKESVRAYTIGEICSLAGVQYPLIVKIDVEGAQTHLFKKSTAWVGNTHLIMLELDDWLMPWQGTSRPFFSCISQYPFDYLISGETLFCFRDFEQRDRGTCEALTDTIR